MANRLYASYQQSLLTADADLDDIIKLFGTDHGVDTPVPTTDNFIDDITSQIGTSGAFAGKTFTDGLFDANDVVVTAVSAGPNFESFSIFDDTPATPATKDLIAYFDTPVTGLPLTPNGGDITYAWDNGANRIFKIGL